MRIGVIEQIGKLLKESGAKEFDESNLPKRIRGKWFFIYRVWGWKRQFKFRPPTMLNFGFNNTWDQIDYNPRSGKVTVFHGHFTDPGIKCFGGRIFSDSFANSVYPKSDIKRIVRRVLFLLKRRSK